MAGLGRGGAAGGFAAVADGGAGDVSVGVDGGGGGTEPGRGMIPCGVIGGGGTDAGRGTAGAMGLTAAAGASGGGGTDPRRGEFTSVSADLNVAT
jgi:hypothetical protein